MKYLAIMLMSFFSIAIIAGVVILTFNIQDVEASGDDDICAVYEPLIEDCMTIVQTNCFCEIIIVPEEG